MVQETKKTRIGYARLGKEMEFFDIDSTVINMISNLGNAGQTKAFLSVLRAMHRAKKTKAHHCKRKFLQNDHLQGDPFNYVIIDEEFGNL